MQATLRKPLCVFLGSFLVCQRLVTPGSVTRQGSENTRESQGWCLSAGEGRISSFFYSSRKTPCWKETKSCHHRKRPEHRTVLTSHGSDQTVICSC